ncbi:hypothetical protein KIPB_001729, partial [Kipferlia bialata]
VRIARARAEQQAEKAASVAGEEARKVASERRERMEALRDGMDDRRLQSRQDYLAKRVETQAMELKAEIADEHMLFDAALLTEKELADRKAQEERLAMIERYQKERELAGRDIYVVPEGHVEQGEAHDQAEDQWERDKLAHGRAQDELSRKAGELLLDMDQIRFVALETIAGSEETLSKESLREKEAAQQKKTMKQQKEGLPIFQLRDTLLDAVRENQVIVLVGETGCGKTTQVMQYLVEDGYAKKGCLVCTQPRRVAAMSVAARVAQEMNCGLGSEVGYQVRFEDRTSKRTILKYVTDGMLLREFLVSPDLENYSVVMLDEAHERTIATDILIGLLKDLCKARPDLRVIISSATLNAAKFADHFDCPVFQVSGRHFPIEIFYTPAPESHYIDATIVTALQIHGTQPKGDILIFLTGQHEIEETCKQITKRARKLPKSKGELLVYPLYSALPAAAQQKIFDPTPEGARKVVVSTNIAETSITIPGVVYVIDSGLVKQTAFNHQTGSESLVVVPESRASARQRSGRGGRVSAGKCFRIFTASSYQHDLDESTPPEIQRSCLSATVLLLLSAGIGSLMTFDFLDPPPHRSIAHAFEELYALGALSTQGDLTALGRRMAELPLNPCESRALLAASEYGVLGEVLTVIAMLNCQSQVFLSSQDQKVDAETAKKRFYHESGDHIMLLNIFNTWRESNFSEAWANRNFIQYKALDRARDVREQLEGTCDRMGLVVKENKTLDWAKVVKSILKGFCYNTASLSKQGYRTMLRSKLSVKMHPESSLNKAMVQYVMYHQMVFTTQQFLRTRAVLVDLRCPVRIDIQRVSQDVYLVDRRLRLRLINGQVLVRQGGGGAALSGYLRDLYAPFYLTSQDNLESPGLKAPKGMGRREEREREREAAPPGEDAPLYEPIPEHDEYEDREGEREREAVDMEGEGESARHHPEAPVQEREHRGRDVRRVREQRQPARAERQPHVSDVHSRVFGDRSRPAKVNSNHAPARSSVSVKSPPKQSHPTRVHASSAAAQAASQQRQPRRRIGGVMRAPALNSPAPLRRRRDRRGEREREAAQAEGESAALKERKRRAFMRQMQLRGQQEK